jgi:uncharacterized membrane protein YeiH
MLVYYLNLLGCGVFAASGTLAAGRKGFDLLGVAIIAAVTAVGGGTVRDLLLDRHPVFWIAEPAYLYATFAATAVTLLYVRLTRRTADLPLLLADALGLALFTISGTQLAEDRHVPAVVAVLMGAITGSVGGVIRDVLANDVPLILRRGELYATASLAGATLYLILERAGIDRTHSALAGMSTVATLRFAAIAWGLRLPTFEVPDSKTTTS